MSAWFMNRQRLGAIPAVAAPSLPRNKVLQGDCIELMAEMPEESVDFILTDPPYICRYRDRRGRKVANDDNPRWLRPAFAEAYRVLKPGSICISFYGWNQADLFLDAWRAAGFQVAGHLVFIKDYASSARFIEARHECAYLLTKGRPPMPTEPLPDVRSWRYTGNKHHPTEKPVSVLEPLIKAFCPPSGLVLDPFCGSGSTLVAAGSCGRDYVGIEVEATHCQTAINRIAL